MKKILLIGLLLGFAAPVMAEDDYYQTCQHRCPPEKQQSCGGLKGADLEGARLYDVVLCCGDLGGANLKNAHISGLVICGQPTPAPEPTVSREDH